MAYLKIEIQQKIPYREHFLLLPQIIPQGSMEPHQALHKAVNILYQPVILALPLQRQHLPVTLFQMVYQLLPIPFPGEQAFTTPVLSCGTDPVNITLFPFLSLCFPPVTF